MESRPAILPTTSAWISGRCMPVSAATSNASFRAPAVLALENAATPPASGEALTVPATEASRCLPRLAQKSAVEVRFR